jgi:hypothetical protein
MADRRGLAAGSKTNSVSWQVTPLFLGYMLADPDAEKANRVTKAIMEMGKIDIAALNKAAISLTA